MSSTGANKETPGGTMKNVIDNPETKPQSHTNAGDQSHSNQGQGNKTAPITSANQESPGGTMKNVINNPGSQSQSHTNAGDQSRSNTQQGNNKCSTNGQDHKPGENNCDSCRKN